MDSFINCDNLPLNTFTNLGFVFHITNKAYTGIPESTINTAAPISEAGDVTIGTAIRKTDMMEKTMGSIIGIYKKVIIPI